MDVVEEFLQLRRDNKGDAAYAKLAPGASFGCPWGGMHFGQRVHDLLKDEERFEYRGYLDHVPIEQIGCNTFQRKFTWYRGMLDQGGSASVFLPFPYTWREIYFVKDGRIRLVTADKQPRHRTLTHFFGLDRLF